MSTPQRYSIFLAVNVDQTRDLKIFSLTLSQLSYPRNVVMTDLILELLISVSWHVEVHSEYHAMNMDQTRDVNIFSPRLS